MPRKGRGRASRRAGNGQTRHSKDQSGYGLVRSVPDLHRFVRRDLQPLTIGAAGAGVGFGFSFSLSNLPNSSDFTNLFDSYRIDRVDAVILGSSNSLQVYAAVDYDDAVAPTGIADMLERQNVMCKTVSAGSFQQLRLTFVPRMPIEGASAGPQLAPVGMWVDTADPTVQYHGLKLWLQPASGTATLQPQVIFTYHLSFRAAK